MAVTPTTHLEKSIAGAVQPVTHLEKAIAEYGGGGGGGSVTSVNGKTGVVVLDAADVGAAPLQLTATPTSWPDENILMSGTWSGATWEEVMAAVLASRLIQIDVAGMGPVTLLYNVGGSTFVNSCCFSTAYGNTKAIVQVGLRSSGNFVIAFIALADPTVSEITGTTPTIEPKANTIYNCGEVASLTISNPPATGAYSIVFTSGATATVTTFPATILGLEDFAAETNTIYEINVLDNRAVVGSWAVSV